ncbi:MAG TPA: VOC family protein [Chloroflexota bacterium]|nr:VOC family protein [Chloroflexota bacterium]
MTTTSPANQATHDPARVIDPRTALDHVHLIVNDLDRVLPFYTDVLRFKVHRRETGSEGRFVALGAGAHDLLRLTEKPEAPRPAHTASMYHMSFLVKERFDLARWLQRIGETGTPVEGLVHHAPASEAIYLPDPEGNTVELNWDPPREVWSKPGQPPFSGNLPLDTDGLFALLKGQPEAWDGPPTDTTFSHIHLYVGNLEQASRFYEGVLGFERTTAFPGQAVFVSAGGYHHHVAFNIWKGHGIPPQPEGVAGLEYYVVRLPDEAALERVLTRVRAAGLSTRDTLETANSGTGSGTLVHDPAGLSVVLAAAHPS